MINSRKRPCGHEEFWIHARIANASFTRKASFWGTEWGIHYHFTAKSGGLGACGWLGEAVNQIKISIINNVRRTLCTKLRSTSSYSVYQMATGDAKSQSMKDSACIRSSFSGGKVTSRPICGVRLQIKSIRFGYGFGDCILKYRKALTQVSSSR